MTQESEVVVKVAVVIPVYGHSVLLVDAALSILREPPNGDVAVVIVVDGDPDPTCNENVDLICLTYPKRAFALWRHNGGLSAARNSGVLFSMERFADLEAVYFLDADNIIEPASLERGLKALSDHPEADWVYPNLDMIGLAGGHEFSGSFSTLLLTKTNYCEASSLVRVSVFRRGVWFDEQMRLGYEDWDFWLSALELGMRGVNEPASGLRYRKRPESMLSGTRRNDFELRRFIERKHKTLFSLDWQIAAEAAEAPRYMVVNVDTMDAFVFTDIRSGFLQVDGAKLEEVVWTNMAAPNWYHLPPFIIFVVAAAFKEMRRLGLLPWCLWELERQSSNGIAAFTLRSAQAENYQVMESSPGTPFHFFLITRGLLSFLLTKDTDRRHDFLGEVKSFEIRAPLAVDIDGGPDVSERALATIDAWAASPLRKLVSKNWCWRTISAHRRHCYFEYSRIFPGRPTFPRIRSGALSIGLILPTAKFGGAERVSYALMAEFKELGWSTHLFVLGETTISLPREYMDLFETIAFLPPPSWRASEHDYLGTPIPAWNFEVGHEEVASATAWLDVVLNCQSPHFHAVAGHIRQKGVLTVTHVHLADRTPVRRLVGAPFRAIAYEHAYDLMLTCSQDLKNEMAGLGVPPSKLMHVCNAPGYPIAREVVAWVRRRRKQRDRGQKIRALYLGRLDYQKGIEQLSELIEMTQSTVDWRIVGAALLSADAIVPEAVRVRLEPATYDGDELTELYAWTDTLIMLSKFEGVPLSILEAQRLGVVPIATNVGSVPEIIDHENTGVLVQLEDAAVEAAGWLSRFTQDRDLLNRISDQASNTVKEWSDTAGPFIECVINMLPSGRRRSSHL